MRFHLLGPLSLSDESDTVVLQPSKPVNLLAALLVQANTVVSAEQLQRMVWSDQRPVTPRSALHTCVLRLRRIFLRHGVTAAAIEAVPGGYRISADARSLDLLDSRAVVRRAGTRGDPEQELADLRAALSLWQGSLLTNVRSVVLQRDVVPLLTEEWLRIVERVGDLELALARYDAVIGELWAVTRDHPGHARIREQLIEALYRSGRQDAALAEYRHVKEYLREELGIDPPAALQRLELAVLRGEDLEGPAVAPPRAGGPRLPPASAAPTVVREVAATSPPHPEPAKPAHGRPSSADVEPTASAEPPGASASAGRGDHATGAGDEGPSSHPEPDPHPDREAVAGRGTVRERAHLPPGLRTVEPTPEFAGREAMVDAVRAEVAAARAGDGTELHLICGAPGVGKTAVARQVATEQAGRFPGGVVLLPMTAPDGVPLPGARAAEVLARYAAAEEGGQRGPMLVILDDVWDAEQVRSLVPLGAGCAVLVTSRRGLAGLVATHGGRVHRLDVCSPPESRLLLSRAVGTERGDAEPGALDRLADLCGHHPLALRVAGARLLTRPELPLADGVRWLAADPPARLSLADDPRLSVPEVLGDALGRLPDGLADVFLRVGAAGTATFTARDCAARLAIGTTAAEGHLEQLVDAGLLEDGPPGPYRMLSLLRAYSQWVAQGRVPAASAGGRGPGPVGQPAAPVGVRAGPSRSLTNPPSPSTHDPSPSTHDPTNAAATEKV